MAMRPTPFPSIAFTAAALSAIAAVSTSSHFMSWLRARGNRRHVQGLPTGPVRAGDDLEQVAVGVSEVHAATTVVVVDLARSAERRVGPVVEPPLGDPTEDLVELVLADQERVVLRRDLALDVVVVERHLVADLDDAKGPEARRRLQPEDLGEERRRPLLVPAPDDGVIELHAHTPTLLSSRPPGPGVPHRLGAHGGSLPPPLPLLAPPLPLPPP